MPLERTNPIPSRLSQARREKGWTQERAAAEAGLSRSSIARFESPNGGGPSQLAMKMLAAIYGKPYEWFFGGEEPPGDPPREPPFSPPMEEMLTLLRDIHRMIAERLPNRPTPPHDAPP